MHIGYIRLKRGTIIAIIEMNDKQGYMSMYFMRDTFL